MKANKTALLVVGGVALLTGFIILNMMRNQQSSEQTRLQDELAVAQRALSNTQNKQLAARKGELEQQASQRVASLKSVQQQLSSDIASIDSSEMVFIIASSANVEITEISSNGPLKSELDGIPCLTLPLTIRAQGEVANLVDFIHQLTVKFPTGVVSTATIDVPEESEESIVNGEEESEDGGEADGEESSEAGAETGSETIPKADIRFIIYTYQGK